MDELEREALGLWKKYGFILPSAVREFLHRLAVRLEWHEMQRAMK